MPRIELVGEVANFAQTVQAIAELEPAVLLLGLHLAGKGEFTPALVKSQLACVHHILAVSFSNDAEARDLAQSYGAKFVAGRNEVVQRAGARDFGLSSDRKISQQLRRKFGRIASELKRLLSQPKFQPRTPQVTFSYG